MVGRTGSGPNQAPVPGLALTLVPPQFLFCNDFFVGSIQKPDGLGHGEAETFQVLPDSGPVLNLLRRRTRHGRAERLGSFKQSIRDADGLGHGTMRVSLWQITTGELEIPLKKNGTSIGRGNGDKASKVTSAYAALVTLRKGLIETALSLGCVAIVRNHAYWTSPP